MKKIRSIPKFYDHNLIIDLYEKGMTPQNIRKQIGCSKSTILRVLTGRIPPRRKVLNGNE